MSTDVVKKKRTAKHTSMARINARISRRLKDKVERAANLRDQTVTDFLAGALEEAASRVIVETVPLHLSVEAQLELTKNVFSDEPFPPVEKMTNLRRYAADYAKMVERK